MPAVHRERWYDPNLIEPRPGQGYAQNIDTHRRRGSRGLNRQHPPAAHRRQRRPPHAGRIAGHAFDNEAPMYYAEAAAGSAWAKTMAFLADHLPVSS